MMRLNTLAALALGLSVGLSSATLALAKGHDQGVADGTRINPSNLRGGVVASNDVAGVGRDEEGNFLGVVDLNHDLTYGQDVVANQRATDTRRVKPVDQPGLNKPPLAD